MTDSPYNELGYFRDGLRAPAQRKYLQDQPEGVYRIHGNLPPGFLVAERFLSPEQCRSIVDYAETQKGTPSTVQAQGTGSPRDIAVSHTRITDYISIAGIQDQVLEFMRRVFVDLVQTHYGERITWFEQPEILRYRPGGHYDAHVDAENWDKDAGRWVQGVDRHYSLLLYLNGEFTGGEIDFPNFGLRLAPKPGMMVLFPSDHRYVHAAYPTLTGSRYVLVCWGAVTGRRLIHGGPPAGATVVTRQDQVKE
ncbi:MAG: 2OG-Fe(II) oxygenase [Gammaproteobacteria bacterium]|nr:2OG-Fe(II) oxygenase [Gammaproteobacteria bacterium]